MSKKANKKKQEVEYSYHDLQVMYTKAQTFKWISSVFLVVGVIIMFVVYIQQVDGQLLDTLKRPLIIVSMFVPLLPWLVMHLMAKRAEAQYLDASEKAPPAREDDFNL